MLRKKITEKTLINRNVSNEGEHIEYKVERIVNNNEPIKDGAPITYTERADGVMPEYDIRADKMDIMLEAATKANKMIDNGRQAYRDAKNPKKAEENNQGGANENGTE